MTHRYWEMRCIIDAVTSILTLTLTSVLQQEFSCVFQNFRMLEAAWNFSRYSLTQRSKLFQISSSWYYTGWLKKDGLNWTVNGVSIHATRLRHSKFSTRSTDWLAWATLKTVLNSSHVLLRYTWSAGAFAFTQTAYLLKLVIPMTNALPHWRLNVETKTKRTLHSSRRLSFNELKNVKKKYCK